MPTTVRYPEPTQEQLADGRNLQVFAKDGSILTSALASVAVMCMDDRHDKRKISAQCADLVMESRVHEASIDAAKQICLLHDELGNDEVNLKAFNIIRRNWLSPYNHGSPGGRYSADALGGFITIAHHGLQLSHVFLADHDGCQAEQAAVRPPWDMAVQWTMHDLWQAGIRDEVEIATCSIRTYGSNVTNVRTASIFDFNSYGQMVSHRGGYSARLPTDDGNDAYMAYIPALGAEEDAGTLYRRFQLDASSR